MASAMSLANKLSRNFDILIILGGIAIIPLSGPYDSYVVSMNDSTASGAGFQVLILAALIIYCGLLLRVYRFYSGRL
jgi:hypothetical protein